MEARCKAKYLHTTERPKNRRDSGRQQRACCIGSFDPQITRTPFVGSFATRLMHGSTYKCTSATVAVHVYVEFLAGVNTLVRL